MLLLLLCILICFGNDELYQVLEELIKLKKSPAVAVAVRTVVGPVGLLKSSQTFQPLSHANQVLKTSPEKPGDWDLKPGDFQNMCQIIKKALFV